MAAPPPLPSSWPGLPKCSTHYLRLPIGILLTMHILLDPLDECSLSAASATVLAEVKSLFDAHFAAILPLGQRGAAGSSAEGITFSGPTITARFSLRDQVALPLILSSSALESAGAGLERRSSSSSSSSLQLEQEQMLPKDVVAFVSDKEAGKRRTREGLGFKAAAK
jgi:hypothetical protein